MQIKFSRKLKQLLVMLTAPMLTLTNNNSKKLKLAYIIGETMQKTMKNIFESNSIAL